MNKLKINLLRPDAIAPSKAYDGDLGWDLYCVEDVVFDYAHFNGKAPVLISTGIACEFPDRYGAIIKDRSGMAANQFVTTHAGVIDSHYRGEIKVLAYYHGNEIKIFAKGSKIAQMILIPVIDAVAEIIDEFSDVTSRGENGFGSSGQ